MEKYMILCVAGQSNAVGFDESQVPENYLSQFRGARIRQLGLYGEDNLKAIPLGACAQNYQDLRPYGNPKSDPKQPGTKGMHLPLADRLLDFIPADFSVLVLPCAYGGVGFTVGEPGSYDAKAMRPSEGPCGGVFSPLSILPCGIESAMCWIRIQRTNSWGLCGSRANLTMKTAPDKSGALRR